MFANLKKIDRIMLVVLLLVSLLIYINYHVAGKSIFIPLGIQWLLVIIGLVYLIFQVIRVRSPQLAALTSLIILVMSSGTILHLLIRNWRNDIWLPLGKGTGAMIMSVIYWAFRLSPFIILLLISFKKKKNTAK